MVRGLEVDIGDSASDPTGITLLMDVDRRSRAGGHSVHEAA
jgi:hypothetical protein